MTLSVASAWATLRTEMRDELTAGILPFWMRDAVDRTRGGFVGLVDASGRPVPSAPKGGVLNARIVWSFSAAYRALRAPEYAAMADRAVVYFASHFIDPSFGGVFWMVDADGRPLDERKYVYAQAFAMYALAEHHRAFGSAASLRDAINIFLLVDQHAHDALNGGYHEAFTRDWNRLADARLSAQDLDAPKSMNTHLHLLEAHTALYAVWPDPLVRLRLVELIVLFLDTIIADGGRHVVPFFDARWQARSGVASFGHDVESSWLITAAAAAVDDEALLERARCAGLRLATGVLEDGVDQQDGGLFLQRGETGVVDTDKEWWPQAEAIVGFMRAYDASGDERFFHAALSAWTFVRDHMRDATGGEWRRRVRRDGAPYLDGERVGPWKCPYHNTRACVEIISDLHGHTR